MKWVTNVDASEKETVQAEIDKVKAILERTQPEVYDRC